MIERPIDIEKLAGSWSHIGSTERFMAEVRGLWKTWRRAILDTDVIIDHLKKKPDPMATQLFHRIKERRLTYSPYAKAVFSAAL